MSRTRPRLFPDPRFSYVVKVGLALGLLALAIATNRDQIREVLGRRPDLSLLGLGFLMYFSGVLLAYVRWLALARALSLPLRLLDALRLGLIGTLFNLVIPGAVGGDVVKAASLCREQSGRKGQAIASVVIDRIIGLLGLFLLACVLGTVAWSGLEPPIRRLVMVAWGLTLAVILILMVAFAPGLFRPLASRLAGRRRLSATLHALAIMGAAYRERLGVVGLAVGLATVTHILNVLAFFAASHALFPVVPDLAQHFLIVPLVLLSTAIPLPFGALGVSEQVSFALFRLANYQGGAVAMMAFRSLQYLGAVIALVVYIAKLRQVRRLTAEAAKMARDENHERAAPHEPAQGSGLEGGPDGGPLIGPACRTSPSKYVGLDCDS
ncbi:hypothetical protein BH23PLA1_BH23PLA1_03060 [soil metagenome]